MQRDRNIILRMNSWNLGKVIFCNNVWWLNFTFRIQWCYHFLIDYIRARKVQRLSIQILIARIISHLLYLLRISSPISLMWIIFKLPILLCLLQGFRISSEQNLISQSVGEPLSLNLFQEVHLQNRIDHIVKKNKLCVCFCGWWFFFLSCPIYNHVWLTFVKNQITSTWDKHSDIQCIVASGFPVVNALLVPCSPCYLGPL